MRALLALAALAAALLAAPARATSPAGPEIVTIAAFQSKYVPPRRIDIWLPPGYAQAIKLRYRVLYMHDGQNLFDPATAEGGKTWRAGETLARLITERRTAPTIVVGIWNSDSRWWEYAPELALRPLAERLGAFEGRPRADLKAEAYLSFLVEELKPEIDRRYRTVRGPEGTAVMGSSMGGLISTYALARYPEVFGGAAALSMHTPVVMPGEDPPERVEAASAAFRDWLAASLPKPPGIHRLYMDRGDQTLDRFYATYQDKLDAAIRAAGWSESNFMSRVFPGTGHDEAAWAARLDVPLIWLLPPH